MSSFDGFLKKMMSEHNDPPKNEVIHEGREKTGGSKRKTETPRPETRPKPRKTINENHDEDSFATVDDDDIVERAFQYAATFTKIVKKNFPNKSDREIVLKSVRAAINLIIGEESPKQSEKPHEKVKEVSVVKKASPPPQEIEYEHPNEDLDPYEIIRQAQTSRLPENYNPNEDVNITTTYNEKGEAEVDLSSMTNEDIHALRVLSGIENIPKQEEQVVNE